MQKVSPFLWFDTQAEEAAKFYTSIFKNSRILEVSHYGEGAPGPAGTVMAISFELEGQKFNALNGGPHFKFNESVSFLVDCATQKEIDYFTEMLTSGGGVQQPCGWVKDKYGLSWQIVPPILGKMLSDKNRKKANAVMQAMLQMKKLDIAKLQQAYETN